METSPKLKLSPGLLVEENARDSIVVKEEKHTEKEDDISTEEVSMTNSKDNHRVVGQVDGELEPCEVTEGGGQLHR